jgi:acyl carrier protein
VEEILERIWQELLRVERVGRQDNFFELGGHSLHVVKLIVMVKDRLTVTLSVSDVFQYSTFHQMANIVGSLRPANEEVDNSDDLEFEQGVI